MRRLTVAFVAGVALSIAGVTPVSAAAAPTGTIRLVSQTAWVNEGGEFVLRLVASTRNASDLEVAVTVYPALATRSDFNETLSDRVRGSAVSVTSTPLTELPVDADGAITLRLPIQDAAQTRDPFRIRLRGAGVYPAVVELRAIGGGRQVDRFTTHVINVPGPGGGPKLAAAVVLPVAAPPAVQADGTRRLGATWSTALRALTSAADIYSDVPLTLLPQAETLQALADSPRAEDRDTVAALAKAAANRLVLSSPYVRLIESAYAANGLGPEEAAQRRRGLDALTLVLGKAPDPATAVIDDGLDDATANRLHDAGAARAIVRDRALAPISLRTTLTQPFQLRGRSGRRLAAAVADEGLAAHFVRKVSAPLAAHQLLADLAVLYFDSPGLVRGVVALPPPGWQPTADFLAALLDGLRTSPILTPVDVSGLFAGVPTAVGSSRATLVRDAAPTPTAPALPLTELRKARRRLAALQSLTVADNPAVVGFEDRILAAQSADLRTKQHVDYLNAADGAIQQQLNGIRVPPNQSITLTARRGEIPVTILRDVPYPVQVTVQLSSAKLQFPEGASTPPMSLTRRNTTIRFTVQARTSGTFPMQVTLKSPDGKLVLSTGRFTIRSSAASGVGVILSVSALCFLVLWWGRHIVQARRTRRATADATA